MQNEIFNPLKKDHPLIGDECPMCTNVFKIDERTVLVSIGDNNLLESNIRAIPVHARCAFEGAKTIKGKIIDILDGIDTEKPVVTDNGNFTFEECGLKER